MQTQKSAMQTINQKTAAHNSTLVPFMGYAISALVVVAVSLASVSVNANQTIIKGASVQQSQLASDTSPFSHADVLQVGYGKSHHGHHKKSFKFKKSFKHKRFSKSRHRTHRHSHRGFNHFYSHGFGKHHVRPIEERRRFRHRSLRHRGLRSRGFRHGILRRDHR